MKKTIIILGMLIFSLSIFSFAYADIVTFPTPHFFDVDANKDNTALGYYRFAAEDWDWHHAQISGPFTSASLQINAWDVDQFGSVLPEQDAIYGEDGEGSGTWIFLGYLTGNNNIYSDTIFAVPLALLDDISSVSGLHLMIDIDQLLNSSEAWAVSLKESELTVSSNVPEPATMLLLGSGLIGLAGFARRRFKK